MFVCLFATLLKAHFRESHSSMILKGTQRRGLYLHSNSREKMFQLHKHSGELFKDPAWCGASGGA